VQATTEVRVAMQETPGHRPGRCEPITAGTPVTLRAGSSLRLRGQGQLWVAYTDPSGTVGLVPFQWRNIPVVAFAGPFTVTASSAPQGQTIELCDPEGASVTAASGP
jgi:hypothetical protein